MNRPSRKQPFGSLNSKVVFSKLPNKIEVFIIDKKSNKKHFFLDAKQAFANLFPSFFASQKAKERK